MSNIIFQDSGIALFLLISVLDKQTNLLYKGINQSQISKSKSWNNLKLNTILNLSGIVVFPIELFHDFIIQMNNVEINFPRLKNLVRSKRKGVLFEERN